MLDNASVWPDDSNITTEIEAYRKRVKDVLDFEMSPHELVHPWMQHGFPVKPKLRIFDLGRGENSTAPAAQYNTPKDLWLHLDKALGDASSTTNRHLIFLEDIDPKFGEVLGVKLGIPPEFWLAHCSMNNDMRVVDRSIVELGSSTY
jgi:hypothetical protein